MRIHTSVGARAAFRIIQGACNSVEVGADMSSFSNSNAEPRGFSPTVFLAIALTLVLSAAIAHAVKPQSSDWDPAKRACHAVWNATAYANGAMLVLWFSLGVARRGAWRWTAVRLGVLVSLLHLGLWWLMPGWS
jgi:hypothetical protein